jgi:hypothetical protein
MVFSMDCFPATIGMEIAESRVCFYGEVVRGILKCLMKTVSHQIAVIF